MRLYCVVLLAASLVTLSGCLDKPKARFGAVVPSNGSAAVYGQSIEQGLQLAYEHLSNGADLGYELDLVIRDSKSDPQGARELLEELYRDGALAVIGGVTSAEALEMVSIAHDQEKILLSPTASSPELSGSSSSFFRIFPTSREEAVTMATFATERLELKTITVVSEAGPFGEGARESFESVFPGQIEKVVTFGPEDDLAEVVQQALDPRPKGIYLIADGPELSAIIMELRAGGFNLEDDRILATTSLAHPKVIAETNGGANGAFITQTVYDLATQEGPIPSFVQSYQEKYGEPPDYYAAHGYDSLMVFAEALKEGGAVIPSEFKKGMRAVQNFAGVTGNIQFRESGDVQKFMRIYFIADGKAVDFEKFMEQRMKDLEEKRRELQRKREELLRNQP